MQLGFYIQAAISLFHWEAKRKDRFAMIVHHIATIGLLVYSDYVNLCPIGLMVLLIHDICDVFMESAKVCRYCNYEFGTSFFFVLFFLSWIALRLVIFPLRIIRSTIYECLDVLWEDIRQTREVVEPHYTIFNVMLLTLLVLHIYWSYFIARILVRQIQNRGKVEGDVREDDDD
mmetsp:Transcript_1230/g.8095  ORF Transcript_1230/g.8095 Transcript_1230/m.8095 type:complete len:174 (+) Transcript_1230:293-814(+)